MTIKPTPQSLARICLPSGALTIAAGAAQQDITLALGGFALLCVGLTATVIHAIRDTAEERRQLQRDQRQVEAERRTIMAMRVRVNDDEERLCRLGTEMERDTTARLTAEREAMLAELEDKKAAFVRKGFDIGLRLNDRDVIGDALRPRPNAKVIQLPVAP